MAAIRVNAQENARSMLRTQARYIGTLDGANYYNLDGDLWKIESGIAYRWDKNDNEAADIRDQLRRLS